MDFKQLNAISLGIASDLDRTVRDSASFSSTSAFLKNRFLKYRLRKPDWLSYIDRSFSWVSGQYALGITASGLRREIRALCRYYDKLLLAKLLRLPVFEVPDQLIHAEVLLILYSRYRKKRYRPLIREAAELLKVISGQNNGLVAYWPPDPELLVDTLGMITNFCYHYTDVFADTALAEIADRQIRYTEQFCLDTESGFPFHAYDPAAGRGSGASCWGRGVGWYLLGLSAYTRRHPETAARLLQVYQAVFRTQDSDGYLYDNLAAPTHIDSSATCMAALSLAESLESGLFTPQDAEMLAPFLSKSLNALCRSTTADGKVLDCSGECRAPGQYSTEYGNFFSQGYTLALFMLVQRSERLQQIICSCKEEKS